MTTADIQKPQFTGLMGFFRAHPEYQVLAIVLFAPLIGMIFGQISFSQWIVLTLHGVAMGTMLFLMSSGMTLVFGLMHVLNMAHGAFISVGAFVAAWVLYELPSLTQGGFFANIGAMVPAILLAGLVMLALGWAFERVIVKPVYGNPIKQIMITLGGAIVIEQLILAILVAATNASDFAMDRPASFRGSFILTEDIIFEKYRLGAMLASCVIFYAMYYVLNKTKIGLLIRAGVESTEMVESLGYRIGNLFITVFVVGAILAGIGGAMWGLYVETITPVLGEKLMISVIIIIIIGGLGSVNGCFIGAILVALVTNYVQFLIPEIAEISTVLLMVIILMWRPQGLVPVIKV